MENYKNILYPIIVLVVIAVLVFVTIKVKNEQPLLENQDLTEEINMNKDEFIKITILKEGNGPEAKSGDNISVNYTGMLTNNTIFDSNIDPKFGHTDPFIFSLGAGQVIQGWDRGIEGMKVGEKRKLEIAPEYAYGEYGIGEIIPPNSVLIFEVELLEIIK